MRNEPRGHKAKMMDAVVTAKHMAPNLAKTVRVQKTKKKDDPAVVMALPVVALPMVFKANRVRCKR